MWYAAAYQGVMLPAGFREEKPHDMEDFRHLFRKLQLRRRLPLRIFEQTDR